jgi:EAL domain-containing protein (putative c-di-GMP-specific phosphodiesterase class I)
MFINSIPNQMLSYKDTLEIESKYGEYLSRLVVELLENEQADSKNSASKIGKIKQWNSKLAIDDFGSGYNNESVLLDVTPNFVKIDMDIVQGVEFDPNRKDIIKNLTSYAKSRGIKIIAEGIETREQLKCVLELGVDYVQGYYLGRPEFIPQKLNEEVILGIKEINNM